MDKSLIFFILIVVVISGVVISIYFLYEKPIQNEENKISYRNVSIRVIENDKQISTQVVVLLDESSVPYYFGNTSENGFLFIKIPINRTFSIYNINIKNQTYYTNKYMNNDLLITNTRIDFPVKKVEKLSITSDENLNEDTNINLNIKINGTLEFATYCVRWSKNIIFVDMLSVERRDPPQRLKNKVDRCFYTKQPITKDSIIQFFYKKFGELDSNDFIEFYLLDGDIQYNIKNLDRGFVVESTDYKDIAYPDIYYKINLNKN